MSVFNLYPPVNATAWAGILGVSPSCLNALNATVACDPSTFGLTRETDTYFWTQDNITTLCTSDCQQSATQWYDNVENACEGFNITLDTKSVPMSTVAGRYLQGLNIACLDDGQGGSCLVDSQTWQGSDLFYDDDGTPSLEQNMTGMYPSSLLCGQCFLPLLLERLSSPYVSGSGFASYLNYQYYDIQQFCNITNGSAIPLGGLGFMSVPAANLTVSPGGATNCSGQTIPSSESSSYQCDTLSTQYNVGTGDLQLTSGNVNCSFGTSACAPAACTLMQIPANDTCDDIAASLSTSSDNVTTVQFLNWNPNILGVCDALSSQYGCAAPPGGAYTLQVTNATNAAAGDQGEVSATFSTVTSAAPSCTNGSAAPGPTPNGAITDCCKWYQVASGDSCYAIWQNNSITADEFYSWNPEVNTTTCGIWLGYDYCIDGPPPSKVNQAFAVTTHRSINTIPTDTAVYVPLPTTGTTAAAKAQRAVATPAPLLGSVYQLLTGRTPLDKRDCSSIAEGSCSSTCPCSNGACCSESGFCGYSPSFCGNGNCTSNCNAKAECGEYAAAGNQTCPLNVCCSQYGFCGTTDDFCGTGCQTGYGGTCGPANRPSSGGSSVSRAIGYYEGWATERPCDVVDPEDLNLSGLTHLNFAFAYFDPDTFEIQGMDSTTGSLFNRFTGLKSSNPGIQTWISIGGWSFTDPGPTQTAFSDMASSSANRQKFILNLMKFMKTYGFDGVDIDWEYPGADDRGGVPADTPNFVSLVSDIHTAFGSQYGLSVTIPTSYYYMQHFDLVGMEPYVSWFNLMAYDLHGTWDGTDRFVGPYINPHTNLTEIQGSTDLLWRAGVNPSKVVLGEGWYGRSFTLADPSCSTPNGVCQFTTGGNAGPCSQASGILTNAEIQNIIAQNDVTPVYNEEAAVNWITWDSNQWVSYDTPQTYQQKRNFANSLGLSGTMVWALDQDNQNQTTTFNQVPDSPLSLQDKSIVGQLTGSLQANLACYTSGCGDGCRIGYNEIAKMSGQTGSLSTRDQCNPGSHQSECCIGGTKVGKCVWRGYKGHGLACNGGCMSNEVLITTNTNSITKSGLRTHDYTCTGGYQSLCCAGFSASLNSLNPSYIASSLAAQATNEAKKKAKEVIDKAAGELCDVLVPEILTPIELAELEIPILGEIADIAEEAAIPGLIDLCKKELEKGSDAIIGWKGTSSSISLAQPASTPGPDSPCAPETCGTSGNCPNKRSIWKKSVTDEAEVALLNANLRRDVNTTAEEKTNALVRRQTPLNVPGNNLDTWFNMVFASTRTAEVLVSDLQGADGESTSDVEGFYTQPFYIGVQGLYGCTSLVVVSHSGAYITHFWEKPNFVRGTPADFQDNVITPLAGHSKIQGFNGLKDLPAGWFTGSDVKVALVVPTFREMSKIKYPSQNSEIMSTVASGLGISQSSIIEVPYDNTPEQAFNMDVAAGKIALTYGNNVDGTHASYQVYIGSPTNGQNAMFLEDTWVRDSDQ